MKAPGVLVGHAEGCAWSLTVFGATAVPALADNSLISSILVWLPAPKDAAPHVHTFTCAPTQMMLISHCKSVKQQVRVRPKSLESNTTEFLFSPRTVCIAVSKDCDIYFSP